MKVKLFILGALHFLLLVSATANAQKTKATVDYIQYELSEDGNATVISSPSILNRYRGDIVIPQSIEVDGKTYAVTAIGDDAFDMCNELKCVEVMGAVKRIGAYAFSNSGLTSLVLHEEDALKEIGQGAFSGTFALSEFTIPASADVELPIFQRGEFDCGIENIYVREGHPTLKDIDGVLFTKDDILVRFPMARQGLYDIPDGTVGIGDRAFSNSKLSSVGIPESVEDIGSYAFQQSQIGGIDVPNGVKSIGDYAFSLCSNLTDVTFGETITSIGEGAFIDCIGLTSIDIPNNVSTIGQAAFSGCINLAFITIPDKVTTLSQRVFQRCSSLTSVNIPNSVTTIDDYAFYGCSALTSITIPDNVTAINSWTFRDCKSLTTVIIPNSVTTIGSMAFQGCTALTSIDIPGSVKTIDDYAFQNCSTLTSIDIPNSVKQVGQAAFWGCSSLTSVSISSNLTDIKMETFMGCSGLKSVTIPSSVKSIDIRAFDGCGGLTTIISEIEHPFEIYGNSSDYRVFDWKTINYATLWVPEGAVDKYKETEGWKEFAKIKENTPDGIASPMLIQAEDSPVYDLQGRRIAEGKLLQPGIYVKAGRKFVVKE